MLTTTETSEAIYGKVIAKTAANTLVIAKGVTVNELVVEGGNVRVEGNIKTISKAETLTSPVYIIKEAGATLLQNTTGFTVIDATAYEMKAALANGENYILTAHTDITNACIIVTAGFIILTSDDFSVSFVVFDSKFAFYGDSTVFVGAIACCNGISVQVQC